jgi:ferric-dicitrate binding protein FerR (iron transport regulator)
MNQYDKNRAKENIIRRIRKEKMSIAIYQKPWFKYAAAAILVVSLGYFFKDSLFTNNQQPTTNNQPIIVNNQIKPGEDKATLTLENGEEVTLTKGTQYQTQNASSNGEEIVYRRDASRLKPETNTLTIPRGGQFYIKMSDGTQVWLNSESQLKYPVSFTDGESRQVELVYGEAYFDVSPSTEHNGSVFKVFNNNQEVEVLGTEFNIKANKDETNVYTTLVEGKVAVTPLVMSSRALPESQNTFGDEGSKRSLTRDLTPDQQSSLNINTGNLTIAPVDVYYEVSWKDGIFNFKNKSLKDIMRTLSRWYDMDVVIKNKDLESVTFTGALGKSQPIEEILSAIQSTVINNYEIHDKTIIIE